MSLNANAKPNPCQPAAAAGPFGFAILLAGGKSVREEFLLTTPNKQ
jgi:hypothetical protein